MRENQIRCQDAGAVLERCAPKVAAEAVRFACVFTVTTATHRAATPAAHDVIGW